MRTISEYPYDANNVAAQLSNAQEDIRALAPPRKRLNTYRRMPLRATGRSLTRRILLRTTAEARSPFPPQSVE